MTVKDLKEKLNDMPEDADIVLYSENTEEYNFNARFVVLEEEVNEVIIY